MGFEDEVWWSRLAPPGISTWSGRHKSLRLCASKERPPKDTAAKALACYGLFVPAEAPASQAPQSQAPQSQPEQMLLRFVAGRPVSAVTCQFLDWVCARLFAQGKRVLVLVWDNASWHISKPVKEWIKGHNRQVKASGVGLRVLVCPLPSKSPWLNRIEPKWVQGKRAVVEPERVLSPQELTQRICSYFGCDHLEPLQQKLD